jgi:DNA-binding LacI/PurR family transcriptional regulator
VAYRTEQSTRNFGGVLAFIAFGQGPDSWRKDAYVRGLEESARNRAESLGYQMQIFWAEDPRHQKGRLNRILQARGIQGVLLARQTTYHSMIPVDLTRFAVIGLSRSLDWTGMDFVTSNHFTACSRTFAECVARGYLRIGFVPDRNIEMRFNKRMLGAYLSSQAELASARHKKIPHHFFDRNRPEQLILWFQRHRPDVVITPHVLQVQSILQQAGYESSVDFGLTSPSLLDEGPEFSGIRQPVRQIGSEAVDMLHAKILLAQWGSPNTQKSVVLDGDWNEGSTLRAKP